MGILIGGAEIPPLDFTSDVEFWSGFEGFHVCGNAMPLRFVYDDACNDEIRGSTWPGLGGVWLSSMKQRYMPHDRLRAA